jgi:hypothetical protein
LFTAAGLLEKIKTVDGADSGLDADKLDRQERTYYAPLAALGNDTNFASTITNALMLKAPLENPELTGTPTAPTAEVSTNNTQIATTEFVRAAITALVNSSPEALDTLNELAAALGNNPNFATDIINALAFEASLASPALTGTPTAPMAAASTNTPTAFVRAAIDTRSPDFTQNPTGTLYKTVTTNGPTLIPKGIYCIVAIGAGGSAGSSAGTYDDDRSDVIAGTGCSGSSGEMVVVYIKLDQDTRCYIACGNGGVGPVTPSSDISGEPGKRGGNTECRLEGRLIIAYGGAGGTAGAKWTTQANAPDGESSEVASGGVGVKGNGDNTIGAPGVKKIAGINVGDGLKDGVADTTAGRKGNTGGGINGKNGGTGGTYASINGGNGAAGCGGGSPYADTYAGSQGNGGKAGNGGNGYVEFFKLSN